MVRVRQVLRNHVLQGSPHQANSKPPQVITDSSQLKRLQPIVKDLQAILEDDPPLSEILGGSPVPHSQTACQPETNTLQQQDTSQQKH